MTTKTKTETETPSQRFKRVTGRDPHIGRDEVLESMKGGALGAVMLDYVSAVVEGNAAGCGRANEAYLDAETELLDAIVSAYLGRS